MTAIRVILTCALVIAFLYFLFFANGQSPVEDTNINVAMKANSEELIEMGHEIMGLQEYIMKQEMKQEVILEEVKK